MKYGTIYLPNTPNEVVLMHKRVCDQMNNFCTKSDKKLVQKKIYILGNELQEIIKGLKTKITNLQNDTK